MKHDFDLSGLALLLGMCKHITRDFLFANCYLRHHPERLNPLVKAESVVQIPPCPPPPIPPEITHRLSSVLQKVCTVH
jgi:hypothetical protein